MAMDEKIWSSGKVCNYIFNFMAMSCLVWLIILLHLSKVSKLVLVISVHYNYKWIVNPIVGFNICF